MRNYVILNEPHEHLEVKPGNNDTVALVQKRCTSSLAEWNIKVMVLNRPEALKVYHAIGDIVLSPKH